MTSTNENTKPMVTDLQKLKLDQPASTNSSHTDTNDAEEQIEEYSTEPEQHDSSQPKTNKGEEQYEKQPTETEQQEAYDNLSRREQYVASLAKDDSARPRALCTLAGDLADYACLWNPAKRPDLLQSLDLAKQAYDSSPAGSYWQSVAMFTQGTISLAFYNEVASGDNEWLLKAEEHMRDAIRLLQAQENNMDPTLYAYSYALRNQRLAFAYKIHFDDPEIGGQVDQIESAISCMGIACDTQCCKDHHPEGGLKHMDRFSRWCRWFIIRNDMKDMIFQGLIEFALTKPHDLCADPTDDDANPKGNPVPNYWNILIMRSHQWVKERKSEQFDELINFAEPYWRRWHEDEYYGPYVSDPTNPAHILRVWAYDFEHTVLNMEDFKDYPSILETAIVLWEEVLERIGPLRTYEKIKEAQDLMPALENLCLKCYGLTGKTKYGWSADSYAVMGSKMNVRVNMADGINFDDEKLVEYEGFTSCAFGYSNVTKKKYCVWGANPEFWPLKKARLMFADTGKEGSPGDWIKGFNDDGTWEIGEPEPGKDDDVIAFYENYTSGKKF